MALDTPGFSLLETKLRDPVTLRDDYPEFQPYKGKCRFSHAITPPNRAARCARRWKRRNRP